VFTSQPDDLSMVSSEYLFIGAADPDSFDAGEYTAGSWTDGGVTVEYWVPFGSSVSDTGTIFKVVENTITKYYKNRLSLVEVTVDGENYYFRNAPHFNSLFDQNERDAHYETDALLDHLFTHPSTAPFVAYRMIQRFGTSNPSATYMTAVSTAFMEGEYVSGGHTFGSGKYGDMEATIAAVLLDREARSVVLDADPSAGSLREPMLRALHFFRALEYDSTNPLLLWDNMDTKIGQEAHNIPNVFSYFFPEYSPPGVIGEAQLTSPESYVANTPKVLGLISGLFSMSKYGLVSCEGGFYSAPSSGTCGRTDFLSVASDYALGATPPPFYLMS